MNNATGIRWGRIIVCAILLEVLLIAVTTPISWLFGMRAFFVVVPVACFVLAFLLGMVVGRKRVQSRFVLHGTLVGIVATALYVGLVWSQYGSIMPVVAIYGPFLFYLSNGLRILGAVAGGFAQKRKKAALL